MPHSRVAIVGAGLTGPLLAIFLARRGHLVTLYERRPDPRRADLDAGRSINLALSVRGIDALERAGLADAVLAKALPMRGRILHDLTGGTAFQSYSADGRRAINSVSRAGLNRQLVEAAAGEASVEFRFDHRLTGLDHERGEVRFETPDGAVSAEHDIVIGADGAYSVVRERLTHVEGTDFSQTFLPWGYKELSIPARDGEFALDPGALHIWPRGGSMMIALPNLDRSFTATLFWPNDGPSGFAGLDADEAITDRFRRDYPDALALMPDLPAQFREHPLGSLVTVHCWPWFRGRTALIGDAAHAIVPFYGQGMNCGFEDVVELDRCLSETMDDWSTALPRYAERRRPNADAIAELALDNFVEMRDRVASPVFRTQKRAEHALERRLPEHFVSLYELVSFSTVPYKDVRRRASHPRQAARAVGATAAAISAGVRRRLTPVRRGIRKDEP
jgi:kynurenine 3-monooxygenase